MTKETASNSIRTVMSVMVIMLLAKISGFARDILFAAEYGTDTIESAAFVFASSVPREFLDIVFSSAISASFIPIFSQHLEKKSRGEAYRLADNFISIILVFSAVLTGISVIFAPQITALGLGGSDELQALSSSLLRILLPTIVLSGAAFSLTGVLQSLGEFNIPAGMSLISNLIIIIYYIFFIDSFGVHGLAFAFLVGWGTQLLIQIPPLIKRGYRFRFRFSMKNDGMREIVRLMLPVLVSSWVFPVNTLVNRRISNMTAGQRGVGALNNANVLYSVITGVFIFSIANVVFPRLSRQKGREDADAFADTMRGTVRSVLFFLLPMTAGLIVIAEPLVRVFFERGAFDGTATSQTAYALVFYALGMPGYGLQTILSRGFYASKDGKTPMITGILAIGVNLLASVCLARVLGIGGPPLASSLSINLIGIIMLVVMAKRNLGMFGGRMPIDIIKMLLGSIITGGAVYAFTAAFGGTFGAGTASQILLLALSVGIGVAVYIVFCLIVKLEEAGQLIAFIRNRGR